MHYSLNASAARRALVVVFIAAGALAWASVAAVHAEDGWRAAAAAGAALAFVAACLLERHAAARREPCAIRLMGAQRAILYFPPVSRRTAASRALRRADVTIERIAHWPGRLASVRFAPSRAGTDAGSRRASGSRDLLILADAMPAADFRSLGVHLRCIGRGATLVEYR